MKKITALAIAIVLSLSAFGQTFTENFNDGSFTDGPVWGGNPGIYIINAASELQLMDVAGGTSYLSTPVSTADATTWEFYFRMEFAPSISNQLRIYLNADQADLSGALNGYFLQIGASGSTDALEFRRQDGTSSVLLLSGTAGSVANDPTEARVRIIRDNTGNWELLADYTGGTNFVSEGTTMDATYMTGEHFGFHCEYTATRKDLFYFDDVSIDPIFVDMTPPEITEVIIVNSTALDVRFDEAVTSATANLAGNYSLTGIGNSGAANLDGTDPTLVHLSSFSSSMMNGQSYTLSATNVEDINGNPANDNYTFTYILAETAEPFDLLINEFLADETPVIGLPETEYIELYNPSNKFIQLASLEFSDDSGSNYNSLPNYIIEPGAYLILTDDAANFPSIQALDYNISLTNGGDGILLRRASDLIEIHSKIYEASEVAGGTSLELVNPTLTCAGAFNWILSTNTNGGTPGAQNSEFNNTPDTDAPQLTDATVLNATEVLLTFDEMIDINNAVFTGVSGIINPQLQADGRSVVVTVSTLTTGLTYTITATGAEDCYGNAGSSSVNFTYFLVEIAEPYDVLINEFMADGDPPLGNIPTPDYIELWNNSSKNIDLSDLEISDDSGGGFDALPAFTLNSNAYVLVVGSGNSALFAGFGDIVELTSSLSLNSSTPDGIVLRRVDGLQIHAKLYSGAEVEESKSLELVNPNQLCAGASNWTLSTNPNGGTPNVQNSQFSDIPDTSSPQLIAASAPTETEVLLVFNETINISNTTFTGLNGITNQQLQPDGISVILTVSPLSTGITYTITTTDIEDCYGNGGNSSADFMYYIFEPAEVYDVLINEFMAAPNANSLIHPFEYIELYNRSEKVIQLSSLQLSVNEGADFTPLPSHPFTPGSYVLLVSEDPAWFGNIDGVFIFSTSLLNTQDGIVLRNTDATIIHAKTYKPFEIEAEKSLELLNPNQPCVGIFNWIISEDESGGTPGRENSRIELSPDATFPDLICANFISPDNIRLLFSKALDSATANDIGNYTVDGVGIPNTANLEAPNNHTVLLNFNTTFNSGQVYQITVDNIYDCTSDNQIGMLNTAEFADNETEIGDIIINEVLFDADVKGVDFVEIYNHSNKILNINELFLLKINEDGVPERDSIEAQCPLMPSQYLALTKSPPIILNNYPATPNSANLLATPIPDFPVASSTVAIIKKEILDFKNIDLLTFSDDFHNPLLDNTKGFSLERIDFDSPTEDPNNWESAAQDVRATPGYVNSQTNPLSTEDGSITIEDEVFSPDGDGYEDFLQIGYELDEIGYVANVRIYDARGRQIKSLANNQLLSPRGFFRWNGDLDNGEKARVGLYVVWVELFDTNGKVNYYKKTCVVAGNLGG